MDQSINHIEQKDEIIADTGNPPSQDKELFANLSEDQIVIDDYKTPKRWTKKKGDVKTRADNETRRTARENLPSVNSAAELVVSESLVAPEVKKEAITRITPFVEDLIKQGKLRIFGTHGHLGYHDADFRGHYVYPTKDGLSITVYLQKEIKGDPMDIEGKRGTFFNIDIPLDQNLKKMLLEKVQQEYDETYKEYQESESTPAGLYEALSDLDDTIGILSM